MINFKVGNRVRFKSVIITEQLDPEWIEGIITDIIPWNTIQEIEVYFEHPESYNSSYTFFIKENDDRLEKIKYNSMNRFIDLPIV